jgi:hypothetical protein
MRKKNVEDGFRTDLSILDTEDGFEISIASGPCDEKDAWVGSPIRHNQLNVNRTDAVWFIKVVEEQFIGNTFCTSVMDALFERATQEFTCGC